VILTQRCLLSALSLIENTGAGFSGIVKAHEELARRYQCTSLVSKTTFTNACKGYFSLLVQYMTPKCCSVCGPHPRVLVCDGFSGMANPDGSERAGGMGSKSLDNRKPFIHPDVRPDGTLLEKVMRAGSNYCSSGLVRRRFAHSLQHKSRAVFHKSEPHKT
jgi:hypothetical protein